MAAHAHPDIRPSDIDYFHPHTLLGNAEKKGKGERSTENTAPMDRQEPDLVAFTAFLLHQNFAGQFRSAQLNIFPPASTWVPDLSYIGHHGFLPILSQ